MSTSTIVIGLVIGLVLAVIIWWLRGRPADTMGVLLVAGIAALAIVVTIVRVQQYHDQQAAAAAANTNLAANAPAGAAGSPDAPPLTNGPPREPINLPTVAAGVHPATGGAAPAAAPNPYSSSR